MLTLKSAGIITEFADPLAEGSTGAGEVVRELKDRTETQKIQAYVLGTEQRMGDWQLTVEAGTSEASESQPFAIGGAQFVQEFDDGLGYRGVKKLQLLAPDTAYQTGGYDIDEVEVSDAYTEETESNAKVDIAYDWMQPSYQATFKAGVKVSQREKTAREDIYIYEDFADLGVVSWHSRGLSDG